MGTEEKLILAALKQFEIHGFIAATTKSIAAEAGVAEVTLFRYFGDKKSLFFKVAAYITGNFGLMTISNVKTGDFQADIFVLCQTLLHKFIQFNALFRMLIFEAKKYEDIRLVLMEVRGSTLENIQKLVGHYADMDNLWAKNCAEWLGNSLMGTSLCYCLFHSTEDEDTFVNTHAGMIADALIQMIHTTGK